MNSFVHGERLSERGNGLVRYGQEGQRAGGKEVILNIFYCVWIVDNVKKRRV